MQRRGVPVRATHQRSSSHASQQQRAEASGVAPLDAAPAPSRPSVRRYASLPCTSSSSSSIARVSRALPAPAAPSHASAPRFDSSTPMTLSIPQESAQQTGAGQSLSCGSGGGTNQVQCRTGSGAGGGGGYGQGQSQRGDAPTGGSHSSMSGQGPVSPLLPPLHPSSGQLGQGQPPAARHSLSRSHSLSSLGSGGQVQLQSRQAGQQPPQMQDSARNPIAKPQPHSQPHPHARDIPPIRLPPPALPLAIAAAGGMGSIGVGQGELIEGDCAMHPADEGPSGSAAPSGTSPLRRSHPVHDFQFVLAQRSVPAWEALAEDKIPNTDHETQPTTVTQRRGGNSGSGSVASPSGSVAAASSSQQPPLSSHSHWPLHPLPVLTSPTFVSHGQAWKLVAFPAGVDDSAAAAGFMSLYLRRLAPPLGGPLPSASSSATPADKTGAAAAGTSGPSSSTLSVGSELGKVTVLATSSAGNPAAEVPAPGPPAAPSTAAAAVAVPPAPAPPLPLAAAVASGSLFVRPHFRLTLIHPSGDARANFEVDSSNVDLDFAHPPHKQQQPGTQPSVSQRRPPADASQRDVHTAFGLPRFLHHSAILSQYLDAHGSILLRIEMLDLHSYVWSVPLALAVPPLPSTHSAQSQPQGAGGAAGYARSFGHGQGPGSGHASPPSRIPLLVSSISGAAMAHALSQQQQSGSGSGSGAQSFSPSASSAFGSPSPSSRGAASPSPRQSSSRSVAVATRVPSNPVVAPQQQQSHSALSLHALASFFGGSSANQQQQQQSQPYPSQVQSHSSVSPSPSSASLSVVSSVSSSHVTLGGYEFVLRLSSRHLVSPLLGCARLEDCSLVLALHSRHHYRLREDLSLKVDLELSALPARQHAPIGAGEPWATRALRQPLSALLHAQASEFEWKQLGRQINQMLVDESGGGRGRSGGGASNSSSSASGPSAAAAAAPALLGSSAFPILHAALDLLSLSIVWRIPSFTTLGAARRTSAVFRLRDLTWNVIVDPKGNGEPGYLSVYLALDKTSAACFTHGLCLCPVFLLSILHPTDPAQHLCRRFEDAQFTFERASWGCTMFVSLAVLSSGGWLTGADGALSIEVSVQGARVVRPDDLCVQTKVGGGTGHSHADHAQAEADMIEAMKSVAAAEQRGSGAVGPDGQPLPPPHARVFVTPSSPALGPVGGSAPPVASPTMQPQPISMGSASGDGPQSARSSSSSNSQRRSGHHQRGGSGTFSGFATFNGGSSFVSNESPSPHYFPRSVSPPSSVTGASNSPPLTPMLEYLGQDMEHEDCDSYALAVQTRRFGGAGSGAYYSWSPASPGFDFGSSAQLPHQSPQPVWHPDPSAHAHSAHSSSHSQPPSHSHTPLPPHLLTSTTRHGYVCIVRNSAFTDPKLPQLIGYEVDEDRLMNTFLHALHCDLEHHINITGAEMMRVFRELAQMDFSAYDYLMVFILTHGVDSNTVYAADGAHLGVNELFTLFKGAHCSTLAGKPKLFFVQACRGNCVDYSAREGSGVPNLTATAPAPQSAQPQPQQQGQSAPTPSPQQPNSTPSPQSQSQPPAPPSASAQTPAPAPPPPISVNKSVVCGSLPLGSDTPNEADFLYASSCVPGYISWTNTASGSWYITALCNVLLSYWPNMHLGDILLRVNYAVSRQNKLVERYGSVYQIAAPAFTLTKKLFFTHHSRSHGRAGAMARAVYAQMQMQAQQGDREERHVQPAAVHAHGHGHGHGHAGHRDAPAAAVTTASPVDVGVASGAGAQWRSFSHSAPSSPRSATIKFKQRRGSL